MDGSSQHEFTKEQCYYQGIKRNEVKRETEKTDTFLNLEFYIYSKCTKPNRRNKKRYTGAAWNSEPLSANKSFRSLYEMCEPQTPLATFFQGSCSIYMSISLHIHLLILKAIVYKKISIFTVSISEYSQACSCVLERHSVLEYTNTLPKKRLLLHLLKVGQRAPDRKSVRMIWVSVSRCW